jgi:hypothetical protein
MNGIRVVLLGLYGLASATVFKSSFDDCICSGFKPCQHAFGTECYSMVDHTGGSRICPAETTHCECPCKGISPCHNVGGILLTGQSFPQKCLDTVVMFGQEVCPAGSIHCRSHQTQAATAPTPAPAVEDCRCTLQKPCQSNDLLKKCEATVGAEGECPVNHAQCIPPGLTPSCICGGGRPCQFMHGTECFEKGLDTNGILQCPEHTQECNCPCPNINGDGPCYEKVGESDFCFPLKPFAVCEPGKVHCQRSAALPSNHIAQQLSDFPSSIPSVGSAIPVAFSKSDPLFMDFNHFQNKENAGSCVIAEWSEWSTCSKPCGGGTRERHAIRFSHTSSLTCKESQKEHCNAQVCQPRDCVEVIPVDWSECSMSCGGGWEEKKPRVIQQAVDGGKECSATQRRQCNVQTCARKLDCECKPSIRDLGSPFLSPDKTNAVTMCRRENDGVIKILHAPSNDYYRCAHNYIAGCHCCACPSTACKETAWGPWSSCDAVTGLRTRSRRVEGKVFNGQTCNRQIETGRCGHIYSMP